MWPTLRSEPPSRLIVTISGIADTVKSRLEAPPVDAVAVTVKLCVLHLCRLPAAICKVRPEAKVFNASPTVRPLSDATHEISEKVDGPAGQSDAVAFTRRYNV